MRKRTHEGSGPVLHDGPAFLGLYDDGHDPDVVLIMVVLGNLLLLVHHHVRVCIHQQIVHLVEFPWRIHNER